jgi:hypothetical protein
MEIAISQIENKIYTIRGVQVMLDSDLAGMYKVETKRINEQVKRNEKRFPDGFMFQLNQQEWDDLKSQIATSSSGHHLKLQIGTSNAKHGGRRNLPSVFTEQGVSMLSAVLTSDTAIEVSIQIIQAFVAMRKTLGQLHGVLQRLEGVELKQLQTESKLEQVLKALEKDLPPKQGIFFEGQLFDAHVFASNLIKQATKSLVLVDNYVDENTLLLLSKRKKGISCTVYTKVKAALKNDLEKHNQQYPAIQIIENRSSHDRFLILDNAKLYHIGASLKDLGNKCFAFSRMDDFLTDLQTKLLKA